MSFETPKLCIETIQVFKKRLHTLSKDILNGDPDVAGILEISKQIQTHLNDIYSHQENHKTITDLYHTIFQVSYTKIEEISNLQLDYKEAVQTKREIEYLMSIKMPTYKTADDFINDCAKNTIFTSGPPIREKYKSGLPFPSEELMQISNLYTCEPPQLSVPVVEEKMSEIDIPVDVNSSSTSEVIDLDL